MKSSIIIFIAFASFLPLSAQKENTKPLEKFTELKVYDRIVVNLIKSNENKLVISGDDKDEVEISNKDGLLKIRMEFGNFLEGDEARATLYYTETLTLLDTNENAKIKSDETVTGDKVEIRSQEGGKVDLKIDVKELTTKAITGGEITLTGSAQTQEVSVNTGGQVYNGNLKTQKTDVTVNAGGVADVRASDYVDAKVRAGGGINIYGNPKEVDTKKVFGGKIEIKD